MKKIKEIEISDIYDLEDLKKAIPFYAELNCHIFVGKYGYLHDVGTNIILTPVKDGEEPTGWDTLERDFQKMIQHVYWCWETANEYAYH